MLIWDFVAETVLGQIIDWIYGQITGFLGDFFVQVGNIGTDLSAMSWVRSTVLSFSHLTRAPYVTGLIVTVFECGIDHQTGRDSVKETAPNVIRGSLAVSLFTTAPVGLYKLHISLQGSFTAGTTGLGDNFGAVAVGIVNSLKDAGAWEATAIPGISGGLTSIASPVLVISILILMGYVIIKMFFANLKRGGILLIQIAIGSLCMLSMSRGYIDDFVSWSKRVIGLYLTAFLQATVLAAGLMVIKDQAPLGLELMLPAGKIPCIAGQFGLDTTTRANVVGAIYTAQGAANLIRTIMQMVAK